MSYLGISVKSVIENINNDNNGWFLPYAQRPYVWGSRHEKEQYICKLFDSILRGYPIGGLIVWNTEEKIPYREFVSDYHVGEYPELVEKGKHGKKDKWLVYDGQQRLQTLYSCLKYTFNGKILVYDLFFDLSEPHDPDETGFSFREKNSVLDKNLLRMNELFSKLPDEDSDFEDEVLTKTNELDISKRNTVKKNLKTLWKIYVDTDKNSLAYYAIKTSNEDEVNEIFERLNSGGIALALSDLLFTHIKKHNKQYDFEEKLQFVTKTIYNRTGGYNFSAYNILQLLHLIVKGRVRVDPKAINEQDLDSFSSESTTLVDPLRSFFCDYLWEQFKINNDAIIPRKMALLPIIVYFHEIYKKGFKFKSITSASMKNINQYFIKSQINDWNMQSYVDNFTNIIVKKSQSNKSSLFDFPIQEIEDKIEEKKQRRIDITEEGFSNFRWFSLKVLTPSRVYQFDPDIRGRFNPEIDHIFPLKLEGKDEKYRKQVDVLWNLQPIRGESNGYKLNYHPKLFFTDKIKDAKGNIITGSKYLPDYDYIFPEKDKGTIDFSDAIWDDPIRFIEKRKIIMIDNLMIRHGISIG